MSKRYGNLYSALTGAFEERGLTYDNGEPIKQVGEMMEEEDYRRLQLERMRAKTERFSIKAQDTEATS